MNFLVTGANGAVGREIRTLIGGFAPHAVYTTDCRGNVIFPADLSKDIDDLIFRIQKHEIDTIIHTGAIVDISAPEELLFKVNTEATLDLYHALEEAVGPAGHFVFISSASIYAPKMTVITEDDKICPRGHYEASKYRAEVELLRLFSLRPHKAPRITILRPALIYGPNARFLGANLLAIPPMMKSIFGNKVPGFTGGPITNWVHSEDVARAAVWAIENEGDADYYRIFNVADESRIPFGDMITAYLEAYGLEVVHKIPLPDPDTMLMLKPLVEKAPMDQIDRIIRFFWGGLKEINDARRSSLILKIGREVLPYLFSNAIFENLKIRNKGFYLKYPSHMEVIPKIIEECRSNGMIW